MAPDDTTVVKFQQRYEKRHGNLLNLLCAKELCLRGASNYRRNSSHRTASPAPIRVGHRVEPLGANPGLSRGLQRSLLRHWSCLVPERNQPLFSSQIPCDAGRYLMLYDSSRDFHEAHPRLFAKASPLTRSFLAIFCVACFRAFRQ